MPEFQAKLAEFRRAAGLSQSKVARRAQVSPSYINRLERGDREPPSREVVLRIAAALDLDENATDVLLSSGGYAPEHAAIRTSDHRLYRLVDDFLQSEYVREDQIGLVEGIIRVMLRRPADGDSYGSPPAQQARSGENDAERS